MFRRNDSVDAPNSNDKPTGNGRSSEFEVPYGDAANNAPYTMPDDLLAFTPDSVKAEIEKVKTATDKLKAANKLIPYLQKFTEEWDLFLRQLRVLRTKLTKAEISKAQFEASTRVLAAKLSQALESILQRETEQTNRISQRAKGIKDRAKEYSR